MSGYEKSYRFEFEEVNSDNPVEKTRNVFEYTTDSEYETWEEVLHKFLVFLRGTGFVIDTDMEDRLLKAAKERNRPAAPVPNSIEDEPWDPVYE